ncbi:short-chain dehydrogenase/reductase (SDR) family protein [Tieghemostelium lacteum]|uniref:Short-chain dehydrogenase/reductase (SDR) family protein n=1 Tax=Tieghemostelium lacteum TaxID=361077 RepID=A0A151Z9X0_TIELA|nr:short-chain dehydrogenase/reductase (SDR) family protein [Tieghemostelium lacteum]|eukprot:KYQ90654.1 short-chain dehydrogenase/reductase (SDR) family protein [Tieghemostelium lacteum]
MSSKVWIITGCTSGTGLALAEKLLEQGHRVVGTSRDINKFNSLEVSNHDNFLGLQVDIANEDSIKQAISKVLERFKTVDVLVNNAGYGLIGAVEETSDIENRTMMDALYFGPLNMIRSVLPILREKKSGYIFNVSSVGGIKGFPRRGAYNGAKFALIGMSEALYEDVKPLGIRVSCLVLGNFKTGFQSSDTLPQQTIDQYNTQEVRKSFQQKKTTGFLPGDPKRFADIVIDAEKSQNPPYNIFLGADTFVVLESKINELQQQISSQKISNSNVGIPSSE